MEYSSKNLDHLGIVAGVCKEIGLAAEIDRIVGTDKREIKITYNRSASKYTTIPFGQTKLTDFQRGDLHGRNCSNLSHAA